MCTQAERFAAAVLMQPRAFEPLALEWGLDVLKLQRAFQCSYRRRHHPAGRGAEATAPHGRPVRAGGQVATLLSHFNLVEAVLYAREDKSDPAGWTDPLDLRAKVVRRTRGSGTPATFPICGERGGCPAGAGPSPPAPLAEQAARYGTARYAHDGGCAARARPVFWKGEAGQGGRHCSAGRLRSRPRPPDGRLGHAWAQAQAQAQAGGGGGGSLVGVEGRCPESV